MANTLEKIVEELKKELIGKKMTIQDISTIVREVLDVGDPLDWNSEKDLIENESISFETVPVWLGTVEGINVIFKETGRTIEHYHYGEQKELLIIDIDTL